MIIDDLIVMGHSLGAHVAGVGSRSATNTVASLIGEQINLQTFTIFPIVVEISSNSYRQLALIRSTNCAILIEIGSPVSQISTIIRNHVLPRIF